MRGPGLAQKGKQQEPAGWSVHPVGLALLCGLKQMWSEVLVSEERKEVQGQGKDNLKSQWEEA